MYSIMLYQLLILFIFIQCRTSFTLNNLPLTCESLPLRDLQDLYVGHEQVLLTPLCLMGFSLHQCIIHGSLVRHLWEPRVNPTCTSIGTPHVHVHGNLTPHHYLAPLVIFLCWASFSFFLFFSSPGSLCMCGPFRLSLSLLGRDHELLTTFACTPQWALIPLVEINPCLCVN